MYTSKNRSRFQKIQIPSPKKTKKKKEIKFLRHPFMDPPLTLCDAGGHRGDRARFEAGGFVENAVNAVLVAVAEVSSQCIDETRRRQQQPFLPLHPQHGVAQGERGLQLRQVAQGGEGGGGGGGGGRERRSAKGRSSGQRGRSRGRSRGRRRGGREGDAVQGAAPSTFPGTYQCPTPSPQHPQPQATVVVGIRRGGRGGR